MMFASVLLALVQFPQMAAPVLQVGYSHLWWSKAGLAPWHMFLSLFGHPYTEMHDRMHDLNTDVEKIGNSRI
jgi:hypothetical protein